MARVSTTWLRRTAVGRRRLLGGAALTGAGALLSAACGSRGTGPDSGSGSGSLGSISASSTQVAREKKPPRTGGVLTTAIAGDPPNLDMHANSTYQVNTPMSPVFNQLVRFDPDQRDETSATVVADLAKSWEQTDGGLRYVFKMQEGVTYHDGKPFTSADVKASLERMQNPPRGVVSPRKEQLEMIDAIETPDATTLTLKVKRPNASLLAILAQGWMSIYNVQDITGGFDFKLRANGTGPFRVKEYIRGNRIIYEANKNYFVKGQPYLDGLVCYIIPDRGSLVSTFQSGDVLFNPLFQPSEIDALKAALGPKMVVEVMPSIGFGTINFGQKPIWRDERVRRAISISQNRRDAVDVLGEGQGGVGGYMMAGGVWSLGENDLKQVPGYGPQDDKAIAEAKQLLSAAGMPANMDVQILTRQGATYERLSVFIADGMKKVGINARPRVVETAAAYVDLESRNFDLAPWSHATALDDPDAIYAEFYLTNSPRNYSDLGTAEVDALYLRQSQTLNQQERVKLVHEMEKKALPLYGKIILNWSMRNWARWSHVENYTPHVGIYNHNRLAEVWLDQR